MDLGSGGRSVPCCADRSAAHRGLGVGAEHGGLHQTINLEERQYPGGLLALAIGAFATSFVMLSITALALAILRAVRKRA